MPNTPDLRPILSFLDELSRHNDKAWFDEHRPDYEAARKTFERFVDQIIDEFRASDNLQDLSAKDCIARIYRDIRFSKDKSPYKTNMAALVAPGGWRTTTAHGYYLSIAPQSRSMVAGGLYAPTPEQLSRFRKTIDEDPSAFKQVTSSQEFVDAFGAVEGDRLKTAPTGYDRAHPEIALLQLKQITVVHRLSDQEVLAPDFAQKVVTLCRAMKPFLSYLTSVVQ